ncbi:MAG: CAP domain-containing protein [Acidobacteriota bacterium]
MKVFSYCIVGVVLCGAGVASAAGQAERAAAEELFALGNQARATAGVRALQWDPALAAAAMKHCERMVKEGPIAHRYGGEMGLAERAAAAGAHFSEIEENVAVGQYAGQIQDGWMHSPGHRENLLNPAVDHVGIAVIAARGVLYAVEDFSHAIASESPAQAEAAIAGLIRMSGVKVRRDPHDARLACATSSGLPRGLTGGEPGFIMRWQGPDLKRLPQALIDRLGSGQYREADVGSCSAHEDASGFTAYRMAVLLY